MENLYRLDACESHKVKLMGYNRNECFDSMNVGVVPGANLLRLNTCLDIWFGYLSWVALCSIFLERSFGRSL